MFGSDVPPNGASSTLVLVLIIPSFVVIIHQYLAGTESDSCFCQHARYCCDRGDNAGKSTRDRLYTAEHSRESSPLDGYSQAEPEFETDFILAVHQNL